jgi:hypothetical protein
MTAAVPARWHPGLGGHDLAAWLVGGGYVLALALAVGAVVSTRRAQRRLEGVDAAEARRQRELTVVWVVIAAVLVVLTLDAALDLQTGLLNLMRRFARRNGWYARRREYQREVIVVLLVAGTAFTFALAYLLRRVLARIALVVASVLLLCAFVVLRAISFHYVDRLLATGGRYGVDLMLQVLCVGLVVLTSMWWHVGQLRVVDAAVARAGSVAVAPSPESTLADQSSV